jgi:hypothetical protein
MDWPMRTDQQRSPARALSGASLKDRSSGCYPHCWLKMYGIVCEIQLYSIMSSFALIVFQVCYLIPSTLSSLCLLSAREFWTKLKGTTEAQDMLKAAKAILVFKANWGHSSKLLHKAKALRKL